MKKVLCWILLAMLLSGIPASAEVTSMRFTDAVSIESIQKLDGKQVSIIGYMATLSPISGKYIYLMNMPYQSCPFCVPNTTQLSNTMAVYAKDGQTFDFTDQAIQVTGTMEVGDYTDEYGYVYNYRIVDASYETVDLSTLSDEYRLWQSIASDGIVADINTMFDYVYFVCCWPEYTFDMTDETGATITVNMYAGDAMNYLADDGPYGYYSFTTDEYFPSLITRIRAISDTELEDLVSIVQDAKTVEQNALSDLYDGNYEYWEDTDSFTLDNADDLYNQWYEVYYRFSMWLAKWEV